MSKMKDNISPLPSEITDVALDRNTYPWLEHNNVLKMETYLPLPLCP